MPDLYFGATEEATEAERTAVAEAIAGFGAVTIRETEMQMYSTRRERTIKGNYLKITFQNSRFRATGTLKGCSREITYNSKYEAFFILFSTKLFDGAPYITIRWEPQRQRSHD